MKCSELNTVNLEDVAPEMYDYLSKNMKGITILDGVVGEMVGRTADDKIWKVTTEYGDYFLEAQDIRALYKKEHENKTTADVLHGGKRVKYQYHRSSLVVETYWTNDICKNSEGAKYKLDYSIQMLMDRFMVLNYAGRLKTKEFKKVDGWFCEDVLTGNTYIISSAQIEWMKNKQMKLNSKMKRTSEKVSVEN